ncbi:tripeptidyl-peptidase II Tpp2 [Irineochytrium annulatum]|nr:tripeptidyl-peptidase II Tpp2 [Irineochytrium annulatum]
MAALAAKRDALATAAATATGSAPSDAIGKEGPGKDGTGKEPPGKEAAAKDAVEEANEIRSRIEALREQRAAFIDPGAVYDCVSFNDGTTWRACVDVTERGDLHDAPLLSGYSESQTYASFGPDTMLNFSVNIYDEGEMLSIVTLSGTHGTHVASIAAGCHPTDRRLDGVAPGATLVSLKIGDGRVKGTETGIGLVRAAIELCRLKCDVANISFGEAVMTPDYGRFIQLLRDEVTNRTGCVVVSSASNAGPILSTLGAPGGPTSGVISVGAYATRSMHEAIYNLIENPPDSVATFSSQGPTADGAVGVDVYGPGAAIAAVPEYTRRRGMLKNELGHAYNPYRIARALRTTSRDFGDPFRVGLAQVDDAFHHVIRHCAVRHNLDVHYDVSIATRGKARGIYLRELEETSVASRFDVLVSPRFFKEKTEESAAAKFGFEARVALSCTKCWIKSPDFVILHNEGKSFLLQVDPTKLPPGLHFAEVIGIDTDQRDAGPLFKIPVTVCKPEDTIVKSPYGFEPAARVRFTDMSLLPGEVTRKFITVPQGANLAEVTLRTKERVGTATISLQLNQLAPFSAYKSTVKASRFATSSTTSGLADEPFERKLLLNLRAGLTLEMAVAHFWTSPGRTTCSVEIVFHGISLVAAGKANGGLGALAGGDLIYLNAGNTGVARCEVWSTVRKTDVAAAISIDSCFENFMVHVFDAQKRVKDTQDIYPQSVKLSEGVYTVKAQFVSADIEVLDKLQATALQVDYALSKAISLPAYSSIQALLSGSGDFTKRTLARGERALFFVDSGDPAALPKAAAPGDLLLGKFNLLAGDVKPARLHNVAYVVPVEFPKPKEAPPLPTAPDPPDVDGKDEVEKLRDQVRDLEISHLKKLKTESDRTQLLARLEADHPNHLPLLLAKLEFTGDALDKAKGGGEAVVRLIEDVEHCVEAILKVVDERDLAWDSVASKNLDGEAGKAGRKDADARKAGLITAVLWRAKALRRRVQIEEEATVVAAHTSAFDRSMAEAARWLSAPPTSDGRYLSLWVWRLRRKNMLGAALRLVNKFLRDRKSTEDSAWKEMVAAKADLLKELGWEVWRRYEERWAIIRQPPSFAPF